MKQINLSEMIIIKFIRELVNMTWDILWPLAFGFILSAVIRAFVPASAVSSKMGKNDLKGLGLAGIFGAVSSSCSYAAASMGRSLIIKGATWSNAVAFMIASTNLVFEISLVIISLLGWVFFGGEILGGLLFMALGAWLIRVMISKNARQQAMDIIHHNETGKDLHTGHSTAKMTDSQHHSTPGDEHKQAQPHHHSVLENTLSGDRLSKWRKRLKNASGFFYMDVSMVGKDILLGIFVSALLGVVVPVQFWRTLFLQDNTSMPVIVIIIWNALMGILVAIFAFVCSVGNILLGAVLWQGGISFGGVMAFILSDMVTIPMLLVYRKYYGQAMMWKLLRIMSLAILVTAVAVELLFRWSGWIPTHHRNLVSMQEIGIYWDYKTLLNLVFLVVALTGFLWGRMQMKQGMAHE